MNLARMKKALVAAGTAAVGAFLLGLFTEIPQTRKGWVALVTGALLVGVTAGRITYQTRNPGTDNGSDPELTPAEVQAFKDAFTAAVKRNPYPSVLSVPLDPPGDKTPGYDDGPLSPGDRRG